MTDPVDTNALRAWNAGRADDKLFRMVAAAADEVDRLRTDLNEVATAAGFELDARDGELARLRATVKNAPHAYECFADFTPGSECICWKAAALG